MNSVDKKAIIAPGRNAVIGEHRGSLFLFRKWQNFNLVPKNTQKNLLLEELAAGLLEQREAAGIVNG
jgi:hypothetical protein